MDMVWGLDYDSKRGLVTVELSDKSAGYTTDPTIASLAGNAFTYRFWVQMLTAKDGKITTLNLLPDCAQSEWVSQEFPVPGATAVRAITLYTPEKGLWPTVDVEFGDGSKARDESGRGFVDAVVRAGLTTGEGVLSLELKALEIIRVRVHHDGDVSSPDRRGSRFSRSLSAGVR